MAAQLSGRSNPGGKLAMAMVNTAATLKNHTRFKVCQT